MRKMIVIGFVKTVELIRQRFFTFKDFSHKAARISPMTSILRKRQSTKNLRQGTPPSGTLTDAGREVAT